MNDKIDISIVILTYKQDGLLKNCLKSFYEHSNNCNIEIIVVDNNSQDQCEQIIKKHYPDVKYIQNGKNMGHSGGNNVGINKSRGDYVVLLNADTVFTKPIFDELLELMSSNKKIGMATVQLKNPDGSIQEGAWSFHRTITPIVIRSKFLKRTDLGQKIIGEFKMSDWDRKSSRQVDWVQGSFLIVRKETIEQIGTLDEKFFLYFTDVDWCRRCWNAGWIVYYYAQCSLIHYYHRQSAQKNGLLALSSKATRLHIKDWLKYLYKYWPQIKP